MIEYISNTYMQAWVTDEARDLGVELQMSGGLWHYTMDAPQYIPTGSHISLDMLDYAASQSRGADLVLNSDFPVVAPARKSHRGRPPAAVKKTSADRQAKFRSERVQVKLGEKMAATVRSLAGDFDLSESDVMAELIRFALTNKNWRQTGF